MTEWRDVAGWEDAYQVSEAGEVRRKQLTYRNRYRAEVLQKQLPHGYWQVWLGGRTGRNQYVHRLVAKAFIGDPPFEKAEIAHFDGNKANNHWTNLRWATRAENTFDKYRLDEYPKLTVQKATEIRKRSDAGETRVNLAREFGVSPVMISRIARGRAWVAV